MQFDKRYYSEQFRKFRYQNRITKSQLSFKIKAFMQRAESSLAIAQHVKEWEPLEKQPIRLFWDYWAITISYYSMLYAAKAAIVSKGFEVTDHEAALVALGHLLVPSELEKEDLETLDQAHKIFEDEYVQYFEDAQKEAHTARYKARQDYKKRRLEEIYTNAEKFLVRIREVLELSE